MLRVQSLHLSLKDLRMNLFIGNLSREVTEADLRDSSSPLANLPLSPL